MVMEKKRKEQKEKRKEKRKEKKRIVSLKVLHNILCQMVPHGLIQLFSLSK